VLHKLPRTKYDSVSHLVDYLDWPEAARHFRRYMEAKMPAVARLAPNLPAGSK